MFIIKNYKFAFDVSGLALFFIIMIPNFIWFAIPASNDILRNQSITPIIDTIATVFQVIMVFSLCVIVNVTAQKNKLYIIWIAITISIYYLGWCLYYAGIVNTLVILDLCIVPCLAFILLSVLKKNIYALISSGVFLICHVIYGVINFILC